MFDDKIESMVTITLEHGQDLGKTHFVDLEDLLSYLNGHISQKFPHDDPEFMSELKSRSDELKKDPSIGVPMEDVISNLRRNK